ncbi:hypothetical protein [Leadbetterella sp. DM7]|uniref:hypothetical protein n=1 Tax=Leadbetterella sp. DM7 TaxID=3235085 RepID=UPI00349EDE18
MKIIEATEGWTPQEHRGWNMPYDNILLDSPKGWESFPPVYYLSLGLRLGAGFRPVRLPVESVLP